MHVNDLLKIAVDNSASDLHLKVGSYPMMRVRGDLAPASEEKRLDHEDVVAMSAAIMSVSQRQRFKDAQEVDLAYSVAGLGRFRVNVFQQRGTIGLVLRVIPMQIRTIDELQLPQVLKKIALEERGLVLVTGTTGSGKSTSLAAIIDFMNGQRCSHIMTVEDPIEFLHRDQRSIVNQREVSVDTRSFAQALRSALRQDPDVILVGEMRDLETAQIAIRAALTGHLVFSTLHTNDAPSTVTRLLDMGLPPFLVSSSLLLVIAQRLVRRICLECREPVEVAASSLIDIGFSPEEVDGLRVYAGKGCAACSQTGFRGRIAIHEVMGLNNELKDAIVRQRPANELKELAVKAGMRTLRQGGLKKVSMGVTTIDEVLRVTFAD